MQWEYYTGQKLKTGDILWCHEGGLAFVDSGLTTGEPSRISSIPESWTCDLTALSDEQNGILTDVSGKVFDRIVKFLRLTINR